MEKKRFYCENIANGYYDSICFKPCEICDQSKTPNNITKAQIERASK